MANFLGNNLRYLRRKKGVNQADIASYIGKGSTTIGNWEQGISQPNIEELTILSNFFEIVLDDLIKIDLEKSNLNTKEEGAKNTKKSNLKSNPLSNLKSKNYPTGTSYPVVVNEPAAGYNTAKNSESQYLDIIQTQANTIRSLQSALLQANEKIDQLQKAQKKRP
jgi:transcriptional regulator with XRE-family HTH domain